MINGIVNLSTDLKNILVEYFNLEGEVIKKLQIAKPQNSIVNLVLEEETFESKIRFENLTKEELGALLLVLDLPEGCAHKLGMGKPLGLGSVKITPTLTLIDREKRYSSPFDEHGQWNTGEKQEKNLQQFKDAFATYIGKKLENHNIVNADSYWTNDERMKELKHMLTLEHNMSGANVDWNARTRYMEIKHPVNKNEYKVRPVLPKPSEVVKPETYIKK